MRKTILVAVCFLVSGTAFAQQDKPNSFHLFLTNPGYVSSALSGSHYTGAYGLGFQRMFTPHFSAEASLLRESRFGGTPAEPDAARSHGALSFFHRRRVEAVCWRRHAFGRWQLGVRPQRRRAVAVSHRTLGLRFDAKVMAGDKSTLREMTNGSVGLSWRF